MSRLRRSAREIALTVGATLGLLCILAALAATFLGVHLLVFRSGSMAPTVDTGGVALARTVPASELAVGDIVSVVGDDGVRVTHRVVALEPSGDAVALTLRGDANRVDDAAPYVVTSAERVFLHVARLGYAVSWLASPVGYVAAGFVVACLLLLGFGGGGRSQPPAGGRRRAEHRASERGSVSAPVALLVATGLAVAAVLTPSAVQPTMASWTNSATATGGTFAAHAVQSQAQPTCTNETTILGNIARVQWTHVNTTYEYYWEFRNEGGAVLASGTVGGGQAAGTTVTLDIYPGLIGINANYNVVVRARLLNTTSWAASTTTTTPVRRASVLIIGLAMRCGHA